MRHLKKRHTLGRTASHRKATLQSLSSALIREKRIQTTLTKAKALRVYVEPLITRAKVDNTHNRREVFSALQNKESVKLLFNEVGPKVADRPGGYTRVLKLGFRSGDGAEMAMIELVDYNDVKPETAKAGKKKTRRAGKSNKPTGQSEEKESKAASGSTTSSEDEAKKESKAKAEAVAEQKPDAETEEEEDPKADKTKSGENATAEDSDSSGKEPEDEKKENK